MFERFTDRARKVVVLAQDEARVLEHNYIGTEHVLLGLIAEGHGVACKALESLGIGLETVREQVEAAVGRGKKAGSGHIPFTPRAKRVLELSLRESLQLGHNYIGTEHILLGLIAEGDGVAAQVLVGLGANAEVTRRKVLEVLESHQIKIATSGPRRVLAPAGWLGRLERRLTAIEDRLAAIEDHLGIASPPATDEASTSESGRADKHGDTADAFEGDDEPGDGESQPGDSAAGGGEGWLAEGGSDDDGPSEAGAP
jgi:Clp amino terminal domain, pathogenicity island component